MLCAWQMDSVPTQTSGCEGISPFPNHTQRQRKPLETIFPLKFKTREFPGGVVA